MVPVFVDGVLPPGEWPASWAEVEASFGGSEWRVHLLGGCRRALLSLKAAGCRRAWVDGSFVTGRPAQKAAFGCDFFPNIVEAASGQYFVEFFQRDRDGRQKGIVVIDLNQEEFEQ